MRQNMVIAFILIILVLTVVLITLVLPNSNSKSIIVSFSALAGAAVMFLINANFELKSEIFTESLQTEVTIFHDRPEISQHLYSVQSGHRIHIDLNASEAVARTHPEAFNKNSQKLMYDFIWYSFFGFMLSQENDWKSTEKKYKSSYSKYFRTSDEQKGNDVFFSNKYLMNLLEKQDNIFAKIEYYGMVQKGIFLPPSTKIDFLNNSFKIENKYFIVRFSLDDSQSVSYMNPGSNIASADTLENGKPKYETRYLNININVEYKGARAGSKNLKDYKKWLERFINNSHIWFELPQKKQPDIIVGTENIQF